MNRTQIWTEEADQTSGCNSKAGIAIYFSDFGENSIYRICENGGIPKKFKVEYLRNGLRYVNETHST